MRGATSRKIEKVDNLKIREFFNEAKKLVLQWNNNHPQSVLKLEVSLERVNPKHSDEEHVWVGIPRGIGPGKIEMTFLVIESNDDGTLTAINNLLPLPVEFPITIAKFKGIMENYNP